MFLLVATEFTDLHTKNFDVNYRFIQVRQAFFVVAVFAGGGGGDFR